MRDWVNVSLADDHESDDSQIDYTQLEQIRSASSEQPRASDGRRLRDGRDPSNPNSLDQAADMARNDDQPPFLRDSASYAALTARERAAQ